MNPVDLVNKFKEQMRLAEQQRKANISGGSYFTNNDTFRNLFDSGNWEDATRQLGFINLDNIANMDSPLYQQFTKLLNRNTPGIGVNSLLSGLMASGAGYAGGQSIASARAAEMNKTRQDGINNSLLGFATNMQQQILPQLAQISGQYQSQRDFNLQQQQVDAANSPWGAIGGGLGMLAGNLLAPGVGGLLGGALGGALGGSSGTAGYRPSPSRPMDYSYGYSPNNWGQYNPNR